MEEHDIAALQTTGGLAGFPSPETPEANGESFRVNAIPHWESIIPMYTPSGSFVPGSTSLGGRLTGHSKDDSLEDPRPAPEQYTLGPRQPGNGLVAPPLPDAAPPLAGPASEQMDYEEPTRLQTETLPASGALNHETTPQQHSSESERVQTETLPSTSPGAASQNAAAAADVDAPTILDLRKACGFTSLAADSSDPAGNGVAQEPSKTPASVKATPNANTRDATESGEEPYHQEMNDRGSSQTLAAGKVQRAILEAERVNEGGASEPAVKRGPEIELSTSEESLQYVQAM